MTARLPTPGGDNGNWGSILNFYLEVSHNSDGSLKPSAVMAAGALDQNTADGRYLQIGGNIPESNVLNLTTDLANRVTTSDGGGETFFDAGNSGLSVTLDLSKGNVQKITLTNNCAISLTSPVSGAYRSLLILMFQDSTGGRAVTWPPSVKWGAAGAPVLSSTAGAMDKVLLDTVDGGTTWYGALGPGGY